MTFDIIKDTSTLTTINEKAIKKLNDKMIYAISDAVLEGVISGDDVVSMNIGIGTLNILLSEDSVTYRFIPSDKLEDSVKNTIIHKQNLLEDALDASLVSKITNIYKDLF